MGLTASSCICLSGELLIVSPFALIVNAAAPPPPSTTRAMPPARSLSPRRTNRGSAGWIVTGRRTDTRDLAVPNLSGPLTAIARTA
ncbi:hypothetical protein R80B4_02662 [Fibrobacteres bacterium R8-0-B4]